MEYNRYGVNENPYQLGVLPIGDTSCFEPVHSIEKKALESALSSAVTKRTLASYVITGTSGSGRTAVAHYIMSLYAELLASDPQHPRRIAHYERKHDGNVNGRQVARDILKGLADEVKSLGADLKDGPVKSFRDEMKDLGADYSVQDLQSIANDFSADVHSLDASFTCSVENVPNLEVFRAIRHTFAKSKGLLLCTIVAEQREAILGTLKAEEIGEEIVLGNLADDRTCVLANNRWEKSQANRPIPFESDGLKNAFHDYPRTVGRSLQTLAFMINSKLASYPGASVHPGDVGLRFDEKQIRHLIKLFDEVLK
jgi:hypothetical protein